MSLLQWSKLDTVFKKLMEATQQKPWSPVSWKNINTASAGKYSGHFVSSLCHTHTHQMYLKDNGNLHLLVGGGGGGERLGLCIWKVQLCSSHLLDSHSYSWEQSTKFAHTIYISAILDWTDLEDSETENENRNGRTILHHTISLLM